MSAFEEYSYRKTKDGIRAIADEATADIYAISFYHWNWDDDPRKPVLLVSYNTTTQWNACTPAPGQLPGRGIASSADEAKWNFAFWLQHEAEVCTIGETAEDEIARQQWIESLGYWYTDEQDEEDSDNTFMLGRKINEQFVEACVTLARRLHDEGVISSKFGKPVPILVHELEYYDKVAEATRRANPPGLAEEFEKWIAAMYEGSDETKETRLTP